jgi:hypothetical protein
MSSVLQGTDCGLQWPEYGRSMIHKHCKRCVQLVFGAADVQQAAVSAPTAGWQLQNSNFKLPAACSQRCEAACQQGCCLVWQWCAACKLCQVMDGTCQLSCSWCCYGGVIWVQPVVIYCLRAAAEN